MGHGEGAPLPLPLVAITSGFRLPRCLWRDTVAVSSSHTARGGGLDLIRSSSVNIVSVSSAVGKAEKGRGRSVVVEIGAALEGGGRDGCDSLLGGGDGGDLVVAAAAGKEGGETGAAAQQADNAGGETAEESGEQ